MNKFYLIKYDIQKLIGNYVIYELNINELTHRYPGGSFPPHSILEVSCGICTTSRKYKATSSMGYRERGHHARGVYPTQDT